MYTVALYTNISGETRKNELHVKNTKRVNTYSPWGGRDLKDVKEEERGVRREL